jgi:hypothetical protein
MLVGGKREREGKGEIYSPFYPCTRAPEWNFLCWVVENERKGKERRKVSLSRRQNDSFQDP